MSLRRWTVCLLRGHKWMTMTYPDSDGEGHYLKCRVCTFENHHGTSIRPTGAGMA